jgi:hypothetical protein
MLPPSGAQLQASHQLKPNSLRFVLGKPFLEEGKGMDDRSPEVRFALDSPLEQGGFELTVPVASGQSRSEAVLVGAGAGFADERRWRKPEAGFEPSVPLGIDAAVLRRGC